MNQKSLLKSFSHAFEGLKEAIHERNFAIQSLIGAMAVIFSVILKLTAVEKALVILCVGLVLGAEIINSAIEQTLNFISREPSPEIRKIKNLVAAAVFIFSLASLIVGILIFGKAIFKLFID